MQIHKVSKAGLKESYGIQCNAIFGDVNLSSPMGSTWCEIVPGSATRPHAHFEGEIFYIFEGSGQMRIGSDTALMAAGEAVYIPPNTEHSLTNAGETVLKFISVYWPGPQSTGEVLPEGAFITSAPPTPNGDLHLGHLSGPYVAADVYARYLKMRNVPVTQISGSDDNQSYVATKAKKMDCSPTEVVEKFATNNENTLRRAGIGLDYFLKPSHDLEYVRFTQEFVKTLLAKGAVVEKLAPSLHCETCATYIYEAQVRGLCPNCRAATSGNGCEACGFVNDCIDLIEPVCAQCESVPVLRSAKRLYFELSKHSEKLRAYHATLNLSSHLRRFVKSTIDKGLPDVSVTHFADWGISVGIDALDGQVIYEWLEMAAGYVYLAQKLNSRKTAASLLKDAQTETVQFFGFDNSFFYTLFIPAVLMAYDSNLILPKAFVTNEFYRLQGQKFSTSRDHAIWGDELLGKLDADVIRFYLSYDRPETSQTNLVLHDFSALVDRQLVKKLESWLAHLDQRIELVSHRAVPVFNLATPAQRQFHGRLIEVTRSASKMYSAAFFSPAQVTREFVLLLDQSLRFFQGETFALAGLNPLEVVDGATIALELTALKTLCLIIAPIMPGFAARTLTSLGQTAVLWDDSATPLPEGQRVEKLYDSRFQDSLNNLNNFISGSGAKYV